MAIGKENLKNAVKIGLSCTGLCAMALSLFVKEIRIDSLLLLSIFFAVFITHICFDVFGKSSNESIEHDGGSTPPR